MKQKVKIVEYVSGRKTIFYSLVLLNEKGEKAKENITDAFLRGKHLSFTKDVNDFVSIIEEIKEKHGADVLRPESDGKDRINLAAIPPRTDENVIPISKSRLRLFCLRLNSGVVILGGGCHKPHRSKGSNRYQDFPDCEKAAKLLEQIDLELEDDKDYNEAVIFDLNKLFEIEL